MSGKEREEREERERERRRGEESFYFFARFHSRLRALARSSSLERRTNFFASLSHASRKKERRITSEHTHEKLTKKTPEKKTSKILFLSLSKKKKKIHPFLRHLEKTPNQYIQWRYAIGEDRENLTKVDRILTEEEEAALQEPFKMEDGTKRVLQELVGRRKLKRGYEYECRWRGFAPTETTWMTRAKLEERGFNKLITEVDVKEAARLGMHSKPLTQAQVEKHLMDLGEFFFLFYGLGEESSFLSFPSSSEW